MVQDLNLKYKGSLLQIESLNDLVLLKDKQIQQVLKHNHSTFSIKRESREPTPSLIHPNDSLMNQIAPLISSRSKKENSLTKRNRFFEQPHIEIQGYVREEESSQPGTTTTIINKRPMTQMTSLDSSKDMPPSLQWKNS